LRAYNVAKFDCSRGSAGGACSTVPDPLACLKGAAGRGGEQTGGDKEERGREEG